MKRILIFCVFLCGCSGTMTARLDTVRNDFNTNNFISSAQNFASDKAVESQDSLELLITGLSLFQNGDFDLSDQAFETWRAHNYDIFGTSALREGEILLGGNMTVEYKPYMMDSLFVSYYQIWDAIGAGRKNDVRVIINQSYNQQQKISREYKKLISDRNKNTEIISELNNINGKWTTYNDIMNPALMYLAGIWFLNNGDYSDAQTYLGRTSGMVGKSKNVDADLALADKQQKPKNTIWVFTESGFAPSLHEQRITFPWIIDHDLVMIPIAIATPKTWGSTTKPHGSDMICNVNSMFMTEFKEYQINNTLRDITASAARVALQTTLYDSKSNANGWLGLGASIYSIITTNAEIRTWTTLPEYIYVARGTKSDLIDANMGAKLESEIKKLGTGNYLIYVRETLYQPVIHVFKL